MILAKVVIDATGNADVAAAVGEPTEFITPEEFSLQGASMNAGELGANTCNTEMGFVNDADAWDVSFFPLRMRNTVGWKWMWDQAQIVGSRERRHIVGAYTVTPIDVLAGRTFPDTITQCRSPFDTHGQSTSRLLWLYSVDEQDLDANIPYRAILPATIDGLYVVGLGMSADRDAIPAMRVQRDLQNLGYAAGLGASMAVQGGVAPRRLDVKALQKMLVEVGILTPDVLQWKDNFPLPEADLARAVKDLPRRGTRDPRGYRGLPKLCTNPPVARRLLRRAHDEAKDAETKATYAAALALLGDDAGAETLIAAVKAAEDWDAGWDWSGTGVYVRKVSYLDGYICMLAELGAAKAAPAILDKARLLTVESQYSHVRAIAFSCEALGIDAAKPVLADLLGQPGVAGHHLEYRPDKPVKGLKGYGSPAANEERNFCLRELCLARALYRLGDSEGQGETVLRKYLRDPRSAYARYAQLVLSEADR